MECQEKMKIKSADFLLRFFVLGAVFGLLTFLSDRNYADLKKLSNLEYFPLPEAAPIWERKIEYPSELKIGLIADNHFRPTRINKKDKSPDTLRILKPEDQKILENFIRQMNSFNPNLIVHLGDVIEGTGDPDYVGLKGLSLVKEELEKNGAPVFWVVGNHDLRSVSKEQFKAIFEMENLEYVKDWGDYRFVFLDGNFNPQNGENNFIGEGYIPGFLHPESLTWLSEQLKTDKRVIVFMHQSAMNNQDDSRTDTKSSIFNAVEVREILAKYKVDAIFNGHIEILHKIEEDGVRYYSLAGTKKNPDFQEAYYEFSVKEGEFKLSVFYRNQEKNQIVEFEL